MKTFVKRNVEGSRVVYPHHPNFAKGVVYTSLLHATVSNVFLKFLSVDNVLNLNGNHIIKKINSLSASV